MRPDKDTYNMRQLPLIAARSHDPHTQVGAKIVGPDGETRSEGYNGFPRGCRDEDHPERLERPEKYFWMEHAERNAIYNAARHGTPLVGCTIYLDWFPCVDCARAIVQVGIVRVVCSFKRQVERQLDPVWKENMQRAKMLLDECGVIVEFWTENAI